MMSGALPVNVHAIHRETYNMPLKKNIFIKRVHYVLYYSYKPSTNISQYTYLARTVRIITWMNVDWIEIKHYVFQMFSMFTDLC